MKLLPLTKGKFVIIDSNKFDEISKLKLFVGGEKSNYPCYCKKVNGKWKIFLLHRKIINAKRGQIVDHINRNPLDCRIANLRITSQRNNVLNSPQGEKDGVYFDKRRKKWYARIRIEGGKRLSLGNSSIKSEAVKLYKNAFKKCSL